MAENKFDPDGNLNATEVRARTDVMFQNITVFIEGVQVPFISINIQSNLGDRPNATVQIPSQAGLMDITRYYEPKIHIFYRDIVTGNDTVMFTGNVVRSSYYKSSSTPPQKGITLNCRFKYELMNQVTLDYSGYASDSSSSMTDANGNQAAAKVMNFNSLSSIGMALTGVDQNKVGGTNEINKANVAAQKGKSAYAYNSIPADLDEVKFRFTGFPGVLLNMWNQLKAQSYEDPNYYEGMTKMFIPLVEQGLDFFHRLGGHYYLEELIANTKADPCVAPSSGQNSLETDARLVPPAHKQIMISSVATDVSTKLIYSLGQFSGELTSFMKVMEDLLYSIEYDIVYLNSPAEVPKDPRADGASATYAVDTIIKPQMPFYYAPLCNVWLPNMYDSISVYQDDESIPTRVTAVSDLVPGSTGQMGINYRAPQSIREAVARGVGEMSGSSTYASLAATTASAHFKIGKYEQGRGIRHEKLQLPNWLAYLAESMGQEPASVTERTPDTNTTAANQLDLLKAAWRYRYDKNNQKPQLNPWDAASELNAYQRLLFSAADYQMTMQVAKARTGTLTGIFNPYCIAGYPMDIIDATPTEPSFHAFCVSVSHSITARSMNTQVSFVSAMTYTELGNYEEQYLHPWMQAALKTLEKYTDANGQEAYRTNIVNNVSARTAADEFYLKALGVGVAPPEFLYDFQTGKPYTFSRRNGSVLGSASSTDVDNPHYSGEGNLNLVYRPIETKAQVEERQGIKFIDMKVENYNPVVFSYLEPSIAEDKLLEPGQSMFLDYADTIAEPK